VGFYEANEHEEDDHENYLITMMNAGWPPATTNLAGRFPNTTVKNNEHQFPIVCHRDIASCRLTMVRLWDCPGDKSYRTIVNSNTVDKDAGVAAAFILLC